MAETSFPVSPRPNSSKDEISKLDRYLRPRTGSIIPAFQIGVKGIKLQLKTLPDSLLELDCQRRLIGSITGGVKQVPRIVF